MSSVGERAAEVAEHLASHAAHGYSQPNRAGVGTGGGTGEALTLSDGTRVKISTGDRDCSSLAIECYACQGIDCGGASYTGDMVAKMLSSGNFRRASNSWRDARRGQVLVATGKHAAVAVGGGRLVEALRSERHTAHGQVGDQDGGEIWTRALYDDGWDAVLEYCGPEAASEEDDMPTECVINIPKSDDMKSNVMVLICGDRVHDLDNPEALKYYNQVYKAVHGRDIPTFTMSGSRSFPAIQRVFQALRGGIPNTSLFPAADMFSARSQGRADGNTGEE